MYCAVVMTHWLADMHSLHCSHGDNLSKRLYHIQKACREVHTNKAKSGNMWKVLRRTISEIAYVRECVNESPESQLRLRMFASCFSVQPSAQLYEKE